MVAGVYAAATLRGVNVSGSVSFTAYNVDATIKVYEGSALNLSALGDIKAGTAAATGVFKTGTGVAADQEMEDVALGLEELDDNTLIYQYAVTVTNDGASSIWIAFVVDADDANNGTVDLIDGLARTVVGANNSLEVEAGDTATLVVTYAITPAQLESWQVAEFTFGSSVRMATNATTLATMLA